MNKKNSVHWKEIQEMVQVLTLKIKF
jgi:hypothetical protein